MLKLGRVFNTLKMKTHKNAPTAAVFSGVGGLITAATLASKATPQFQKDYEAAKFLQKEHVRFVKLARDNNGAKYGSFEILFDGVDVKDNEAFAENFKELFCDNKGVVWCSNGRVVWETIKSYIPIAKAVVKNYGPAFLVGSLSVASILWGHNTVVKRLQQTTAAFNTVKGMYESYREEVKEQLGEENEAEILQKAMTRGIETSENAVISETKDSAVISVRLNGYSRLVREKDNGENDAIQVRNELVSVQNVANDMLRARGHIYLNEVYDLIGIPRVPEGNIVGWVHKDHNGNLGYVDLGLFYQTKDASEKDIQLADVGVMIYPNVQGIIYDLV